MKEIKVLLEACHGYSHFGSYSSHHIVDIEVSNKALAALRKIHPSEATCEQVAEASAREPPHSSLCTPRPATNTIIW